MKRRTRPAIVRISIGVKLANLVKVKAPKRHYNGKTVKVRGKIQYHPRFKKATTKVNEHYSYMAKNTYWFDCWENLSYFQEDWPNRQHEIGRKIYLVPSGFKGYEIQEGTIVTTDADAFWAAPVKAVL